MTPAVVDGNFGQKRWMPLTLKLCILCVFIETVNKDNAFKNSPPDGQKGNTPESPSGLNRFQIRPWHDTEFSE